MLVAGLVIGGLAAMRLLMVAGWDPTVFAAFGEEATEITEYAEERLGRDVILRAGQGHDGKYFFVQANDPLVLEPAENVAVIDRPIYRSQRMLFPLLGGGAGLFPPETILWGLVTLNVLALGVGTWAVSKIAARHGVSAGVGLAFGLNFGLLSELFIDGAGAVAFALAALGAWALEDDRSGWAAAAFVGAALTREVMVLFIGFIALMWLVRRKHIPWAFTAPAAVAIVAWAIYLRLRIDLEPALDQVQEITLIPFSGVWAALTSGQAELADYLVIGVLLCLMVVVPYRAWRSDVYLSWGAIGFAFVAPFLTQQVWQKSFDISRALAPLLTVFVLEVFISRRRRMVGPMIQPSERGNLASGVTSAE